MKKLTQDHTSLLLRLTLGSVLLAHGLIKVFVFTVPGTVMFFDSLGFHAVFAYLTIFGEIAAGLAIILGILTRLAALLSLPILIGATCIHLGNGFLFSNPNGGWEYPLVLVLLTIIVAIQNPGKFKLNIFNK